MRLQLSEALVALDHAGRGPSQGHAGIPPAFDVARDAANGAHHVLGDLGRGERSTQLRWHLQPDDSQDLLDALVDGGCYAGPLLVESTREIADQFFSLVGIELPGLAEHATCGRMMLFRQVFRDFARLVDVAALDRGGRTEGAADPFDNAFAPSTMNSLGTVGRAARARPRCPAWPEPLRRSRSLLPPAPTDACCLPLTPIASTSTRSSPRCSASISTEGGARTDRQPWSRPAAPPTTPQTSARPTTSKTRDPGGAGTSPSGSRTARPNRRVDTSISVRLIAPATEPVFLRCRFQLGIVTSGPSTCRTRGRSPRSCRRGSRSVPAFGPNGSPAAPRRDRGAARRPP